MVVPGMENYWELTVPSGVTAPIIIRAASDLPNMNLGVQYAVGDGGLVGAYSSQNVRIISVGGGDVQVSVSWSDSSDVDLHVIDPNGDEIFYGQKTVPSGGNLDLDSNAACSRNSDNTFKSNENIVWPVGWGCSRHLHGQARILGRLRRLGSDRVRDHRGGRWQRSPVLHR